MTFVHLVDPEALEVCNDLFTSGVNWANLSLTFNLLPTSSCKQVPSPIPNCLHLQGIHYNFECESKVKLALANHIHHVKLPLRHLFGAVKKVGVFATLYLM